MPRPLYIIVQTIFVRSWQNLHEFGPHKVLFQTIFTWQYLYVFVQTIFVPSRQNLHVPHKVLFPSIFTWHYLYVLVQTIFVRSRQNLHGPHKVMFQTIFVCFGPDNICSVQTKFACSTQGFVPNNIHMTFFVCFGPDNICSVQTKFVWSTQGFVTDNICMTIFVCFCHDNICFRSRQNLHVLVHIMFACFNNLWIKSTGLWPSLNLVLSKSKLYLAWNTFSA